MFLSNCSSYPACRRGRSIGGSGKPLVFRRSSIQWLRIKEAKQMLELENTPI
jgi:hypothetical protein